jgi:hypothetical protein
MWPLLNSWAGAGVVWLANFLAVVAKTGNPEKTGLVSHEPLGLLMWSMARALAEPKPLAGMEPAAKAFGAGRWCRPFWCWGGPLLQKPALLAVAV